MINFKNRFLNSKKVSIWGLGYLGYTSLLKLQNYGIKASVYDFKVSRLKELSSFTYPNKEQLNGWTKNGQIPSLNNDYITICYDPDLMFENDIHIISFPNLMDSSYKKLARFFENNKFKLKKTLVLFQSVGVPTKIESDFLKLLKNKGINVDVVTLFRSDWTIEDFLKKDTNRTVSFNRKKAYKKAKYFLSFFNIKATKISSIEEAEVFENAKNALNYTILAFFNQLSLSYPHIDINTLSKKLINKIDPKNFSLGVSNVDFKSQQSIEHLIGASTGDYLSILKEASITNLAFLFYYVDLLKKKKISTITIVGLSTYNSFKDIRMSPSVILAEYLNKNNINVTIYDDHFKHDEILEILPFSTVLDISKENIVSDAIVIMNINNNVRFLNQKEIKENGLFKVKLIIDNTGFFRKFKFSKKTQYHQFGDNKLIEVIK